MPFIEVDDDDFDEIVEAEFAKGHIVILKFGSMFCDSCQLMEFELEEVLEKVANVSVLDIDTGVCGSLMYRFNIEQVPTTIVFKDSSSELLHKTGLILADDIVEIINKKV